jgi:hypothetical protein
METIVMTCPDDYEGYESEVVTCIECESKEAFLKTLNAAVNELSVATRRYENWNDALIAAGATLHRLQHRYGKFETLRPEQRQAIADAKRHHDKCLQNNPGLPSNSLVKIGGVDVNLVPFLHWNKPRIETLEEWRRRKVAEFSQQGKEGARCVSASGD